MLHFSGLALVFALSLAAGPVWADAADGDGAGNPSIEELKRDFLSRPGKLDLKDVHHPNPETEAMLVREIGESLYLVNRDRVPENQVADGIMYNTLQLKTVGVFPPCEVLSENDGGESDHYRCDQPNNIRAQSEEFYWASVTACAGRKVCEGAKSSLLAEYLMSDRRVCEDEVYGCSKPAFTMDELTEEYVRLSALLGEKVHARNLEKQQNDPLLKALGAGATFKTNSDPVSR